MQVGISLTNHKSEVLAQFWNLHSSATSLEGTAQGDTQGLLPHFEAKTAQCSCDFISHRLPLGSCTTKCKCLEKGHLCWHREQPLVSRIGGAPTMGWSLCT